MKSPPEGPKAEEEHSAEEEHEGPGTFRDPYGGLWTFYVARPLRETWDFLRGHPGEDQAEPEPEEEHADAEGPEHGEDHEAEVLLQVSEGWVQARKRLPIPS